MIYTRSLGHFAERIISNVPDIDKILEEIIEDNNIEIDIREPALWIYGSHRGIKSLPFIEMLKENKGIFFEELKRVEHYLKEYKTICFYS